MLTPTRSLILVGLAGAAGFAAYKAWFESVPSSPTPPRSRRRGALAWTVRPAPACSDWRSRVPVNPKNPAFYLPVQLGRTRVSVQPWPVLDSPMERERGDRIARSNLCAYDHFTIEIDGPVGPEAFPGKDWTHAFEHTDWSEQFREDDEPRRRRSSAKSLRKAGRKALVGQGKTSLTRNAERITTSTTARMLADLAQRNGLSLKDVGV